MKKTIILLLAVLLLSGCAATAPMDAADADRALDKEPNPVRVEDPVDEKSPESPEFPETPESTVPPLFVDPKTPGQEGNLMEVLNFRTSDSKEMVSETYLIRNLEEYQRYVSKYMILENPFFIDDESLGRLRGVDGAFFEGYALVVSVSVESSGSTRVQGEQLLVKGNVAELYIRRTEAAIGTADIATRHVVFLVPKGQLELVDTVKVMVSLR